MRKVLHIITSSYPYGNFEQYMEEEIRQLSNYFDQIIIYPLFENELVLKELPKNVLVNYSLLKTNKYKYNSLVLSYFLKVSTCLINEFFCCPNKMYFLKRIRHYFSQFFQAAKLSKSFRYEISETNKNYFYSSWMNDGALMLSILKSSNRIENMFFKVNGYDLFDERNEANYIPFKYYNYKNCNKVFAISDFGAEYLKLKNVFPEKIEVCYHGLKQNPKNPMGGKVFTVVSCSSVIPIKRVQLIARSLKHVDFPLKWVHFGDGECLQEVKRVVEDLPEHIEVDLKGRVINSEILEFYQTVPVSVFVHVSETEGLCLAIIEAMSFGIPVIAVTAGGVVDVVNENNGIPLKDNIDEVQLSKHIMNFRYTKNNKLFRDQVQKLCYQKFDAKTNYYNQYQLIIK